ncbi:hypothetical protein N7931_14150 [Catenovulum sp. 2E275]|uniref:hypothetical protein n=1 Tax=Catenovulum sp. 2E275 TaxID=2980497 RepID=UPI0021D05C4C|nr:hypothetical protein [Catenovulum sp. 2E275]MCU4676771.1 hypothetical protein [Catenovulum sp. 2E275]
MLKDENKILLPVYSTFLIAAPAIWLALHELFGGEAACFEKLAVDEHPLGCSTQLQAIVSIVIYLLSGLITLLIIVISSRWFSASHIVNFLLFVVSVFSVVYARRLPENVSAVEAAQESINLLFPYFSILLIIFLSRNFWVKGKA